MVYNVLAPHAGGIADTARSLLVIKKLVYAGALELKLLSSSFEGERGGDMLVSMVRTFADLGGFYLHMDIVDADLLKDAQKRAEAYPDLVVRIAGWSARFVTLGREWQDMILQRTRQLA